MANERQLYVWCFERLAGTLRDTDSGMRFEYAEDWIAAGMPPLSQSLPLDSKFAPEAVEAFFGGLLPEGVPRDLLARRLGVSAKNDFSILSAVGGDTAGAVSLQPPGQLPREAKDEVEWLDDEQLVAVLDELPSRPMHADSDGEYRLSLAGAQDKLPVVVDAGGRVGLTKGQTPSTHILKTPIARLFDTVVNEAFCPAIGRALGIDAVIAEPRRVHDREYLLIERYDRASGDGATRRLHQEDFCQALGIPTSRKYQVEGGPSLEACFTLLRDSAAVPAREVVKLFDYVALSYLVGNHDAHGKNYSLLYVPETPRAALAPAYDIISTAAYQRTHNLTRKMAMSIGGEYRSDYVARRHLDRLIAAAGLGPAAARRRIRDHAESAPSVARSVRAQLAGEGWDRPILDTVIGIVDGRAARLLELTVPTVRARKTRPGRLRTGQEWKSVQRGGDGPSEVKRIRVTAFRDDASVEGYVRGDSGEEMPGVWSVEEFDDFALISDPHWPTYIVAAKLGFDDPIAQRVTESGGELEGSRSHTMAHTGLGGPESSWNIVAPDEAAALDIVRQIVGNEVEVRPALGWRRDP